MKESAAISNGLISKADAISKLGVSSPTFYKWINRLGIETKKIKDNRGEYSYIKHNELSVLAEAMGKDVGFIADEPDYDSDDNNVSNPINDGTNNPLVTQLTQLQVDNKHLQSKVEEYEGYVAIYKEQWGKENQKNIKLEEDKETLINQILQLSNVKTTYMMLFIFSVFVIVISIILVVFDYLVI